MDDVNRNESSSWNAIWDSAGEINETGFTAEIAIPFSQLRFPRVAGEQTWGIDVLRFRPRAQRSRISNNTQDRNRNCYLCQLNKFTGFANAEPGKALEVVPTLTAARTDSRPVGSVGPLEDGDFETEAGLGVRWGITPDLTLDVALNPDFSQVEADFAQLEENNTFASVRIRRRGRSSSRARTTIRARSTPCSRAPSPTPTRCEVHRPARHEQHRRRVRDQRHRDEPAVPGPIGLAAHVARPRERRVRRALHARVSPAASTIGALVTSREGDGYSNEVAGFDGRYNINDQNSLRLPVSRLAHAVSGGDARRCSAKTSSSKATPGAPSTATARASGSLR